MQIAAETATCQSLHALHGATLSEFSATARQSQLSHYNAIRCSGAVADSDPISMTVTDERVVGLQFDNGLAGRISQARVLEPRAFGGRRDAEQVCSVAAGSAAATVVWDAGIRLNPDLLYPDLLPGRSGKEFSLSGLAPTAE